MGIYKHKTNEHRYKPTAINMPLSIRNYLTKNIPKGERSSFIRDIINDFTKECEILKDFLTEYKDKESENKREYDRVGFCIAASNVFKNKVRETAKTFDFSFSEFTRIAIFFFIYNDFKNNKNEKDISKIKKARPKKEIILYKGKIKEYNEKTNRWENYPSPKNIKI